MTPEHAELVKRLDLASHDFPVWTNLHARAAAAITSLSEELEAIKRAVEDTGWLSTPVEYIKHISEQVMDFESLEADKDLALMELGMMRAERDEAVKALEWYADQFCELSSSEGCGKYTDDFCAGCRARSVLSRAKEEKPHD